VNTLAGSSCWCCANWRKTPVLRAYDFFFTKLLMTMLDFSVSSERYKGDPSGREMTRSMFAALSLQK